MIADKNRLLLFAIRCLGVLSAAALLIAKYPYPRLMEALCVHDDAYGGTYREAKVRSFRIRTPDPVGAPLLQSPPGTTAGYRLIVMGDSYMAENRGHETFVRLVSNELKEPAFFASFPLQDPVCVFRKETAGSQAGRNRVVVLERAERYLPELVRPVVCPPDPPEGLRLLAQKLFGQIFMDCEERLRFLLLNSVLTAPLVEALNTELYVRFGLLPDLAPVASREPAYLFSNVEVAPELSTSFYFPHDDALISAIADSVKRKADKLRSDYGVELIFMPIPNKYTLYHRYVRPDRYDDFLPRLYQELKRRNVRFIDLYGPFMSFPESVYLPSDTHWNARGVSIAAEAAVRAVRGARSAPSLLK